MKDIATANDDGLKGSEKTAPNQTESFLGNEDDGSDAEGHGHKMRSGQGWGKGIVADIKRTILTHWKTEMTNLNGKVRLYEVVNKWLSLSTVSSKLKSAHIFCLVGYCYQLLSLLRLHCSCRDLWGYLWQSYKQLHWDSRDDSGYCMVWHPLFFGWWPANE